MLRLRSLLLLLVSPVEQARMIVLPNAPVAIWR